MNIVWTFDQMLDFIKVHLESNLPLNVKEISLNLDKEIAIIQFKYPEEEEGYHQLEND